MGATAFPAAAIVSGTIATPRLGSGTADATSYLRGDQTWQPIVAGAAWGGITGALSAQTDLQEALDAKLATSATTAYTRTLLDDADAATARTTLGLGSVENAAASTLYVGLTGNQTVAGNKTFSGNVQAAALSESGTSATGSGGLVRSTSPSISTPISIGSLDTNSTTPGVHCGLVSGIPTIRLSSGTNSDAVRIDNFQGKFRIVINNGSVPLHLGPSDQLVKVDSGVASATGSFRALNGYLQSEKQNQGSNNALDSTASIYLDRFNGASTAAGLGVWTVCRANDSSGGLKNTAKYENTLIDASSGSFKCRDVHFVCDSAFREYLRADATGSGAIVGIGGAVETGVLLKVHGNVVATGPVSVGVYTFATVPSASANTRSIICISDRAQRQAYSDGTNWRFTADDVIIS